MTPKEKDLLLKSFYFESDAVLEYVKFLSKHFNQTEGDDDIMSVLKEVEETSIQLTEKYDKLKKLISTK